MFFLSNSHFNAFQGGPSEQELLINPMSVSGVTPEERASSSPLKLWMRVWVKKSFFFFFFASCQHTVSHMTAFALSIQWNMLVNRGKSRLLPSTTKWTNFSLCWSKARWADSPSSISVGTLSDRSCLEIHKNPRVLPRLCISQYGWTGYCRVWASFLINTNNLIMVYEVCGISHKTFLSYFEFFVFDYMHMKSK